MTAASDDVLCEIDGTVARVTINRPANRNSVLPATCVRVYEALRTVEANRDVRVLVLRGAGKDFCCGADIRETDGSASHDPVDPRDNHKLYDVTVLLHEMRAVTVAAVRGGCAGAGFGWAAACDFRVAATDVRFNTAFLDVGVAGDMALPWSLPRLLGAGKARDLAFFPRKIEGREALEIGLVERLFDAETFEAELEAFVARLAGSAPLAMAALKSHFVEGERMGLASYVTLEAQRHGALFATEDRAEAFRAYIEKRPAQFRGR
ncbi:enoyl-CoA hydratase-related protein [Novosphingobium sp. KCTC 2891]|uniref:enoyl-CoA hydratase/isomerase family protein n=1 Tax=Novosphingobium sp. KCTC 2891 TaxID=2989730 RepID=UPI00222247BD|nr:enoyl-CoA hydratase-related protein [Novosphingobium sp. KCTC 2891]MCW1381646.1 enoyl-CoA hydratase-related protein [Novosphingobium sp. KCTC 2891]